MKKLLTILLALCLCFATAVVFTACGDKQEGTASLTYELEGNEYYVTGINDQTAEIVIPSKYNGKTVIGIAEDAFRRNKNLTKVTLPTTLKYVDASAFLEATNLMTINLENVESIGNKAFASCFGGKGDVVLTLNKIRSLGNNAFESCKNITELNVVSKDITVLPLKSFASCYRLQKVTLSSSVANLEESCFNGCIGLSNITLDNVKYVGVSAFESCTTLVSINMPKVEFIKDYAFFKCNRLSTVTVGDKVKQIFMYTFRECFSMSTMYLGNCNEVWCGYFVNSNTKMGSFTNGDNFHGSWAYRAMIKDPAQCAKFFTGHFNADSFVCTYKFVESIGAHFGSPSYEQNYSLYPWQH